MTSRTSDRYDVVIVGARCAGAALAVHLRRAGLSVAIVDSASLPSDQPMSTHLVQPPGMDELDTLGVGIHVRALAPALHGSRFDFDGRTFTLRYGSARAAHCLRREKLDGLLQRAASEAGAVLRTETRVVGLVHDAAGRVSGVELRTKDARRELLAAGVVVGADGRHSTVARLVGAKEYLGYDGPRASYWAYWRRPAAWDPSVLYNEFDGDHSRVLFPTDGDHVLVATVPIAARARTWRDDAAAAYLADIRSSRALGPLFANDRPLAHPRVLAKTRYFFRVAAGPGWALAGDAGHHKEFVIGLGISDALRDAKSLATAVLEGTDDALERYWRRRDVERIEMYFWARDVGEANAVSALERLVAERAASEPALATRLGDVIDGRISPYDLFPASRVLPWVARAALRGNVRPIAPLISTVGRALRAALERQRRERLLTAPTHTLRRWSRPGRCAPCTPARAAATT